MSNYVAALIEAVQDDQGSMENQQMADAKTTEVAAQMEQNIYAAWIIKLNADSGAVTKPGLTPSQIQQAENTYNLDSSKMNAAQSQQDGTVQGSQQQTSSDASNLQMKAQMVQAVNGILSTVSGMLGRITA